MPKITPKEALNNLYNATRLAKLTAEEHAFLVECAKVLDTIINPKPAEEKSA